MFLVNDGGCPALKNEDQYGSCNFRRNPAPATNDIKALAAFPLRPFMLLEAGRKQMAPLQSYGQVRPKLRLSPCINHSQLPRAADCDSPSIWYLEHLKIIMPPPTPDCGRPLSAAKPRPCLSNRMGKEQIMALPHAKPREVVDLQPLGSRLRESRTAAIVKEDQFEAVRLVVPAGSEIPSHEVSGSITLHCLEGRVSLGLEQSTVELCAGQWAYLNGGDPHTVKGIEDSSLLLTIIFRS